MIDLKHTLLITNYQLGITNEKYVNLLINNNFKLLVSSLVKSLSSNKVREGLRGLLNFMNFQLYKLYKLKK